MKQSSTLFLKGVTILMGLGGLTLAGVFLWIGITDHITKIPFLGMSLTVIPFTFALVQGFKLLTYIDKNTAFSDLSVEALKKIKLSAMSITILYVVLLPFIGRASQQDDAPGFVILGLMIFLGSIVIAVFAAVLQKLIRSGLDIKSENDLTV